MRAAWLVLAPFLRPLLLADVLRVELPRVERRRLVVWSPEETRQAMNALAGDAIFPLVHVAATTGLRVGEQLALRWDDWKGDALVVERSLVWLETGPRLKQTKTGGVRRVDLYPETEAVLAAHREAQEKRKQLAPRWKTDGLIFPRWTGGYWKPSNLSTQWRVKTRGLPLRPIRWHDLRHTHASHLLAAGVPVPTVAARLGHSPGVLLAIYSHLVEGQQREAVRLGSAYLGLTSGGSVTNS